MGSNSKLFCVLFKNLVEVLENLDKSFNIDPYFSSFLYYFCFSLKKLPSFLTLRINGSMNLLSAFLFAATSSLIAVKLETDYN